MSVFPRNPRDIPRLSFFQVYFKAIYIKQLLRASSTCLLLIVGDHLTMQNLDWINF